MHFAFELAEFNISYNGDILELVHTPFVPVLLVYSYPSLEWYEQANSDINITKSVFIMNEIFITSLCQLPGFVCNKL